MSSRWTAVLVTAGLALTLAVAAPATTPAAAAATAPAPSVRYVDVSVATVWASPSSPRPLDRPALGNPVDLAAWNRSLTTPARLGLVGRVQTQALLGDPVRVLSQRGAWTRIAVLDQPTPLDRAGYPGWVPTRQLRAGTGFGRLLAGRVAVVTEPTARLRMARGSLTVSFGTRLPVLADAGGEVRVDTPSGAGAQLPSAAVRVSGAGTPSAIPTGAQIVATARRFLGVRYLWGGTSAFGFDCSGLVNLIYRTDGVIIPRDADAQARAGHPVARRALAPGDLVFFATEPPSRAVTHVALYAGDGRLIQAPDSAGSVQVIPLSALAGQYVTARRYLAPD